MQTKMKYLILIAFGLFVGNSVNAQNYTPKVSKDSLGILNGRLDALKTSLKVQELKIKEAEEEVDVEKLRIKLLEANDVAKQSALQNTEVAEKIKSGTLDAKGAEKLSKKVKSDSADAAKALERFNKQIAKVDDIRNQILTEERKLTYKKPLIIYNYK